MRQHRPQVPCPQSRVTVIQMLVFWLKALPHFVCGDNSVWNGMSSLCVGRMFLSSKLCNCIGRELSGPRRKQRKPWCQTGETCPQPEPHREPLSDCHLGWHPQYQMQRSLLADWRHEGEPVDPSYLASQTDGLAPDALISFVIPVAPGCWGWAKYCDFNKGSHNLMTYILHFFAFQYNFSKRLPSLSSSTSSCLPHSSIHRYLDSVPSPTHDVFILASTLQEVLLRKPFYKRPPPHTLPFGMLPS